MKCGLCGGELKNTATDLPFKVNENTIVIVKDLPVLQCIICPEYFIDDKILRWVEEAFVKVENRTELEIIRYAA